MRNIINKFLNIALLGLALFAFDKVSDRVDRMGHTASKLAQQVGYSGPMAGIPSGMPDDIDW